MKLERDDCWNAVKARMGKAAAGTCAVALAATLMAGGVGCAQQSSSGTPTSADSESATSSEETTLPVSLDPEIDESKYDLEYSNRDQDPSYDASSATMITLEGAGAAVEGQGASVEGSTVTVSDAGVYVLSGSLDDGQVVVDAPEDAKVQLVLDGVSIAHSTGPALYVKQADKCFVTLADGTSSALSDGATYDVDDEDVDAALYSDCDLTLQGAGSLSVTGNFSDAVKTKDDLTVTGGTYTVTAVDDGLVGHDSVKVADGTFTVDAANDAVKSSKDDDESKGFVSIDGGTFALTSGDKGIKACTYLRVAGGNIAVDAGDDALHADLYARILGGSLDIESGDDAVHAEYVLTVDDGTIDVSSCVEGLEAQVVTINGSTTNIVASDDGINAATGGTTSTSEQQGSFDFNGGEGGMRDDAAQPPTGAVSDGDAAQGQQSRQPQGDMRGGPGGRGGQMPERMQGGERPERQFDGQSTDGQGDGASSEGGRGGMFQGGGPLGDSDENCVITINGGTITVEAEGDGVDSNGYLYVNGGTTYVSGPTNSGNGSLDYGLGAEIAGGTFIAAGSSGMAESFTGGTQASALVNASGAAGDVVTVTDANGTVLAQYTPTKNFQCVVVSAPGMQEGASYTLDVNGAQTTFTASTSSSNAAMGEMGGMDGRGGGQGQMPGMGGPQGGAGRQQGGPSATATAA